MKNYYDKFDVNGISYYLETRAKRFVELETNDTTMTELDFLKEVLLKDMGCVNIPIVKNKAEIGEGNEKSSWTDWLTELAEVEDPKGWWKYMNDIENKDIRTLEFYALQRCQTTLLNAFDAMGTGSSAQYLNAFLSAYKDAYNEEYATGAYTIRFADLDDVSNLMKVAIKSYCSDGGTWENTVRMYGLMPTEQPWYGKLEKMLNAKSQKERREIAKSSNILDTEQLATAYCKLVEYLNPPKRLYWGLNWINLLLSLVSKLNESAEAKKMYTDILNAFKSFFTSNPIVTIKAKPSKKDIDTLNSSSVRKPKFAYFPAPKFDTLNDLKSTHLVRIVPAGNISGK